LLLYFVIVPSTFLAYADGTYRGTPWYGFPVADPPSGAVYGPTVEGDDEGDAGEVFGDVLGDVAGDVFGDVFGEVCGDGDGAG